MGEEKSNVGCWFIALVVFGPVLIMLVMMPFQDKKTERQDTLQDIQFEQEYNAVKTIERKADSCYNLGLYKESINLYLSISVARMNRYNSRHDNKRGINDFLYLGELDKITDCYINLGKVDSSLYYAYLQTKDNIKESEDQEYIYTKPRFNIKKLDSLILATRRQ